MRGGNILAKQRQRKKDEKRRMKENPRIQLVAFPAAHLFLVYIYVSDTLGIWRVTVNLTPQICPVLTALLMCPCWAMFTVLQSKADLALFI